MTKVQNGKNTPHPGVFVRVANKGLARYELEECTEDGRRGKRLGGIKERLYVVWLTITSHESWVANSVIVTLWYWD